MSLLRALRDGLWPPSHDEDDPKDRLTLERVHTAWLDGMLSRKPDAMLVSASEDFRAALKLKRDLKLDKAVFSPKLVAYFDALR